MPEPTLYRALFDHWDEPAVVVDDTRRIVAANAAAAGRLALDGDAAGPRRLDDLLAPVEAPVIDGWWLEISRGRTAQAEVDVLEANGSTADRVRLAGTPNVSDGLHLVTLRDVSAAQPAGPAPLERERHIDEIERAARVGSWTLDPATGEAAWSTEMYRILGLDPDGPAIELAAISGLFTADSVGRVSAAVERAATDGEAWQMDLEAVRPDGSHRIVQSSGIAERDPSGAVIRIHGTMQDITEQRELEAQLQQSQRLEAIGQLAGGIAHDFNNILTAIRGYSQLVHDDLAEGDPRRDDLDHVIAASDRAADLVRQLLAFSRRQVLQPRIVDPAEVVAGVIPLLRRLIGESVELRALGDTDVGRITVDPGQLGQVILNLAVNARDAMPRGGTLTIETTNVVLDEAYPGTHLEVRAGPHVLIAVSDTGHGMDAATQARAFEPFFTTKEPDRGTGMGLSTVHGIVKQSGGSIYLYSEPGRGTTFKLYFPRTDGAAVEAAAATEGRPAPAAGTETILLVEDDTDVRAYSRRVLENAGYTVLEAPDGSVAMEVAASHDGSIDLLLTDVVLPGVHGAELARLLTGKRPGLRVLYVSGFTEDSIIREGVVEASVRFLPKPYRAEDLVRTIRTAIDAEA